MGQLTLQAALVLLCLQCVLTIPESYVGIESIYDYEGTVLTKTSVTDKVASFWSLRGKLTLHSSERRIIMKLDNLETSVFNGDLENSTDINYLPIPENAEVLTEPFVAYYDSWAKQLQHISTSMDEPEWSLNIKKSIASIIQLDFGVATSGQKVVAEKTIYGEQNFTYTIDDSENLRRIIKENEFTINPSVYTNVARIDDFAKIKGYLSRSYVFASKDNRDKVTSINSYANITYKTMPNEKDFQVIETIQSFNLKEYAPIQYDIETYNYNEAHRLDIRFSEAYEYDENRINSVEKTSSELAQEMDELLKKLEKELNQVPLTSFEVPPKITINEMLEVIFKMDQETFKKFYLDLVKRSSEGSDKQAIQILNSILPYTGKDSIAHFIKEGLSGEFRPLTSLWLLTTMPFYINDPSEELIEDLETFMDLKGNVNKLVKHTAILSFASLVNDCGNYGQCIDTKMKFVNQYYNLYKEATDYEFRMAYLLGLANMCSESESSACDFDLLKSIILNKTESHRIRTLAVSAFHDLLSSKPNEVYEAFWPLVKSESEEYELRVVFLDVLLASALSEDQFNSIITTFNQYRSANIEQQHLYNYFYTTILSLQNITRYHDNLGELATASLEKLKAPSSGKTWVTGNYRLSHTDSAPNFGALLQARLLGCPYTNSIKLIHLYFNRFTHSSNTATYSAYIRLEGLSHALFRKFEIELDDVNSIPELLEVVKKNGYKLRHIPDVYIDLVLFNENHAVFAMHIDEHNVEELDNFPLYSELAPFLVEDSSASIPLMQASTFISDMGTPLSAETYQLIVSTRKLDVPSVISMDDDDEDNDFIVKSRSSWYSLRELESVNPINNITIGAYKWSSQQKLISFPFTIEDGDGFIISWPDKEDMINIVTDQTAGTYANVYDNDKILNKSCPFCEEYYSIKNVLPFLTKTRPIELDFIGTQMKVNASFNRDESYTDDFFGKIVDSYNSNSLALPLAEPFLFALHFADQLNTFSLFSFAHYSWRSAPLYCAPSYCIPTKSQLQILFDSNESILDNDPYDVDDVTVSLSYTNINLKDNSTLRFWNVTGIIQAGPKTLDNDKKYNIDHHYALRVDNMFDDGNKFRFCVEQDIVYPSRRVDRFQISPFAPTLGKTLISFGSYNSTSDSCSTEENNVKIAYVSSLNPEYIANVEKMEDYKTCKQQSTGLKFTAPTESCIKVYEELSTYTNYKVTIDYENIPNSFNNILRDINYFAHKIEKNIPEDIIESSNKTLNVSLTVITKDTDVKININDVYESTLDYEVYEHIVDLMLADPSYEAYSDAIDIGLESSCIITPKNVKSFIGKNIPINKDELNVDAVAYVDCVNETYNGLTFNVIDDSHLSFKMWSDNRTISVKPKDGLVKVVVNDEEKTKENFVHHDDFNVYFLAPDVVVLSGSVVTVYYNTEYIFVKANSIYNDFVCGFCGKN